MPYTLDENVTGEARIKIIGVGGGGGNAINNMLANNLDSVQFYTANTDRQALEKSMAGTKIQLGDKITSGLGAGANPEVGRKAAEESAELIRNAVSGADMIFIAAGMGGGTGTGAAPVIARIAKETGALIVGVVTKPFRFEGKRRMRQAEEGIAALQDEVDALIVIPNDRLLSLSANISMMEAFSRANEVLLNAARGITDLILESGYINVDFMDVRSVMSNKGRALMGIGVHKGDHAAVEAVRNAISSPLLEDVSIEGATGVLVNITSSPNLSLQEISEAAMLIEEVANEDANVIWGSVVDPNLQNEVRVTIIATGFDQNVSPAKTTPKLELVNNGTSIRQQQMSLPYTATAPYGHRDAESGPRKSESGARNAYSTSEMPRVSPTQEMQMDQQRAAQLPYSKPDYLKKLEMAQSLPPMPPSP